VSSKQPGSYKLINGRQVKVDKVYKLSYATGIPVDTLVRMMNELNDEEFLKVLHAARTQEAPAE
jgi:hypothetical protein